MNPKSLFRISIATSFPLLAMSLPVIAQSSDHHVRFPHYTVTDLGTLAAGNNSSAFDMNNVGWVAGSSNLVVGGPQHAFAWYGYGPLKDLGTLGGSACRRVSQLAGPDADSTSRSPAGGQSRRQEGVTGGCDCARRDNHRGVTGESLTGRVALSGHAHPGRHPRGPRQRR